MTVKKGEPVSGRALKAIIANLVEVARPAPRESAVLNILLAKADGDGELGISSDEWLADFPESSASKLRDIVSTINGHLRRYFESHAASADVLLGAVGVERGLLRMGLPPDALDDTSVLRWEIPGRMKSYKSHLLLEAEKSLAADAETYFDEEGTSVRLLRNEREVEALVSLNKEMYGGEAIPPQYVKAWWAAYRRAYAGLFRDDRLMGALTMFPLSGDTFGRLADGQMIESAVAPQELHGFSNRPTRHWYVVNAVLRHEFEGRTMAFGKLLWGALVPWLGVKRTKFPVHVLAAEFPGGDGESLLHRFGFQPTGKTMVDTGWPLHRARFESVDRVVEMLPGGQKLARRSVSQTDRRKNSPDAEVLE